LINSQTANQSLTFLNSDLENNINSTRTPDIDPVFNAENDTLTLSTDTADIYFIPYYFEFTAKLSDSFYANWLSNPIGMIKFTFEGENYYGFIVSLKPNLIKDSATDFKLIAAPEGVGLNDLSKLIR